ISYGSPARCTGCGEDETSSCHRQSGAIHILRGFAEATKSILVLRSVVHRAGPLSAKVTRRGGAIDVDAHGSSVAKFVDVGVGPRNNRTSVERDRRVSCVGSGNSYCAVRSWELANAAAARISLS